MRHLKNIKISRKAFYKVVTDRNGCTFVSLKARYIPTHFNEYDKKSRRFPYDGNIFCISEVTCAIGIDFKNAVNNALEKHGKKRNFQRSGEPWGPSFKHDNDAAVIINVKDHRRYLQVMALYREYDYRRLDNQHRIPEENILPWLSDVQNTEGVVLRRYRFDHLLEVVMRAASEKQSHRYILTD